MKVLQRKKKGNLLEVLDNNGNVRKSKEAVSVWRDHFLRLLGGPGEPLDDNCSDSCCAEKNPKTDFITITCVPPLHVRRYYGP